MRWQRGGATAGDTNGGERVQAAARRSRPASNLDAEVCNAHANGWRFQRAALAVIVAVGSLAGMAGGAFGGLAATPAHAGGGGLPDLRVTLHSPALGGATQSFTVDNIGTAAAGPFAVEAWNGKHWVIGFSAPGLAVGGSADYTVKNTTLGCGWFQIVVDRAHAVPDADRTNNYAAGGAVCAHPDLALDYGYLNGTLSDHRYSFEVRNDGDGDAGAFKTQLDGDFAYHQTFTSNGLAAHGKAWHTIYGSSLNIDGFIFPTSGWSRCETITVKIVSMSGLSDENPGNNTLTIPAEETCKAPSEDGIGVSENG